MATFNKKLRKFKNGFAVRITEMNDSYKITILKRTSWFDSRTLEHTMFKKLSPEIIFKSRDDMYQLIRDVRSHA